MVKKTVEVECCAASGCEGYEALNKCVGCGEVFCVDHAGRYGAYNHNKDNIVWERVCVSCAQRPFGEVFKAIVESARR